MKYCSHCGSQLADEAVICPNCGCAPDSVAFNQKQSNSDLMAILGFVFSFISAIVGLILSVIAYKSAVAEGNKRNKNFAVAGIVISSVSIGASVIAALIYFVYFLLVILAVGSSVPPVV